MQVGSYSSAPNQPVDAIKWVSHYVSRSVVHPPDFFFYPFLLVHSDVHTFIVFVTPGTHAS